MWLFDWLFRRKDVQSPATTAVKRRTLPTGVDPMKFIMGLDANNREDAELLVTLLRTHPASAVRFAVVALLGASRHTQAFEAIVGALNDDAKEVRFTAAVALGKRGDRRAITPLASVLDDDVIEQASYRVANLGTARQAQALNAESLKGVSVQKAAEQALTKLDSDWANSAEAKAAAPALIAALRSPKVDRATQAANRLALINDPRAVEPLIVSLTDSWLFLRMAAARALGQLGDARAVEPLAIALKDKEASVRMAAVEALGALSVPEAHQALLEAQNDPAVARYVAAELKRNRGQ